MSIKMRRTWKYITRKKTKIELHERFGVESLNKFLKEMNLYGGNYEALTESEGRAILSAKTLDTARNRILAARQERKPQALDGFLRSARSETIDISELT